MSGSRIVASIVEARANLRPSEEKVARLVMSDPARMTRVSMSALAAEADVSEPTVLRFCRRLGFPGFIDFKLALAGDLAGGTPFVDEEVQPEDDISTISQKMHGSAVRTLGNLRDSLDHAALLKAVEAIEAARRIDICGIAQSNFVAGDLQHRLARMGFAAVALADAHMQMQAVASTSPGDVMIVLSFAGQIRDTVSMAQLARRAGAKVIAITKSGTALAEAADIVVNVDTYEKTFLYNSTATRLAHMLLIDILTTTLAVRAGQPMVERLMRSRLATQEYWIRGENS